MDDTNNSDRFLRVQEVAVLLAVSPRGVWRLASIDAIPAPFKLGGATRWRSSDIQQFIADRKAHTRLTPTDPTQRGPDSQNSARRPTGLMRRP